MIQIDYTTTIDSKTVRGRAGFNASKSKLKNVCLDVSNHFSDLLHKHNANFNVSDIWVDKTHTNFWKVDKQNTTLRKKGKEAKISFMLDASLAHIVNLFDWEKKYRSIFSKAFWYAASVMKITDLDKLKTILSEFDSNFEPVIYNGGPKTDDLIDIEVIFNNLESWTSDSDLDLRDEIRDKILEQLIKTEIGEWSGDSFGENTNEIGFKVVDEEAAKEIIVRTLKEFNVQEFMIEIL